MKILRLAGTPIENVEFVRYFAQLQALDISDTHVVDLAPLRNVRLQELNIAGLDPANLRVLGFLPVRAVTLSPMLIKDKTSLNALRLHRNLKVIRSPDDPAEQTAIAFWQKLDSGYYNEAP